MGAPSGGNQNGNLIGAIGSGLGALGGAAISAFSTGSMNKKTRQWNEHMYWLQREQALNDWARQNEYDNPAAQMERLKAAGLNPNLVYGHGAVGNSSGNVPQTDVKSWNPSPIDGSQFGRVPGAALSSYFDTQIKQATVDNLRTQNKVLEQEALLKAVQQIATAAGTDVTKFDLSQKQALKDYQLDAARLQNRKTEQDITLSSNRDKRETQSLTSQLLVNAENIKASKVGRQKAGEEIENLKRSGKLQQIEINMREKGINPNDNVLLRMISQAVTPADLDKVIKWIKGGDDKKSSGGGWSNQKRHWLTGLPIK